MITEVDRQQEFERREREAKRQRIRARREQEEASAAAVAASHLVTAHTILDEMSQTSSHNSTVRVCIFMIKTDRQTERKKKRKNRVLVVLGLLNCSW